MTISKPPSTLPTSEYDAIEEALLESVRGRWFLAEFARRNRTADTQILLDAITRLENSVAAPRSSADADIIRRDLIEMSEAISQTRREIAAIKPADQTDSQLVTATEELDAIVHATEKATSDILEAAEEIQEVAWLLREGGEHVEICDKLDQRATDVYMACSFQDITGQRTDKVVKALGFLEARINSMIQIWQLDDIAPVEKYETKDQRPDSHLLNGPQRAGRGLEQQDIDAMILDCGEDIEVIDRTDMLDAPHGDGAASDAFRPSTAPLDAIADAAPDEGSAALGDGHESTPAAVDPAQGSARPHDADDQRFQPEPAIAHGSDPVAATEPAADSQETPRESSGASLASARIEIRPATAEADPSDPVAADAVIPPAPAESGTVLTARELASQKSPVRGLDDLGWNKRNALFS